MTLVVIVRLFVISRLVLTCCELAAMLDASCEILSRTELPSLICGVILEDVADFLALDGLERVDLAAGAGDALARVLPVTERHFLRDLISASSLSSVTIEGVAMMFVFADAATARITAAQLVPPVTIWPRPIVRPLAAPRWPRDSARPG